MKTLASLKTVSLLASLVYFPSPTMPNKADRTKKARECFFWSWRKQISLELIEQKANWKWINQGVIIVKAMVFLVTYGFNSWTIKKAKCQRRTDALELWCWRRLLRVPQTARRSNQSILKEINPEYLLEGLLLQLEAPKLWSPDAKSRLTGKDCDAVKDWRQKEEGAAED